MSVHTAHVSTEPSSRAHAAVPTRRGPFGTGPGGDLDDLYAWRNVVAG
jgi:hypothetical protein